MDINPSIYNTDSTFYTDEMEAEETLLQHIAEIDQVRNWKLLRIFLIWRCWVIYMWKVFKYM